MVTTQYTFGPSSIDGAGFQNVVAVDPRGNGVVLSGCDVAGVHRSVDWGEQWETVNKGLASTAQLKVACLYFSKTNPDIVLGGFGGDGPGLYRSNDNGKSWVSIATNVEFLGGNTTNNYNLPSPHPRSTGNLIAWDEADQWVYVGSFKDGLYRGKIDPATGAVTQAFTQIELAPTGTAPTQVYWYIRSVELDTTTDKLWVAVHSSGQKGTSATLTDRRVYQVADVSTGSRTVTEMTGAPENAEDLLLLPGYLYAVSSQQGADSGVWRMPLATSTWAKISDSEISDVSLWLSLAGRVTSGGAHEVFAGCVTPQIGAPPSDTQHKVCIARTADAKATTPTWASVTSDEDRISYNIGDSTLEWWLFDLLPSAMLGYGAFVAADMELSPPGSSQDVLMVAGRSGMWRGRNPSVSTRQWNPVVKGMAVTINRGAFADPDVEDLCYDINTDWVFFYTVDNWETLETKSPSPNIGLAAFIDRNDSNRLYVGTGERDTNTAGRLHSVVDVVGDNWTDEGLYSGSADNGADNFNRTVAAGDWGVASDGTNYLPPVTSGNQDASNASVNGTTGVLKATLIPDNSANGSITVPQPNSISQANMIATCGFYWTAAAAGGQHNQAFTLRHSGAGHYEVRIRETASGQPQIQCLRSGTTAITPVVGASAQNLNSAQMGNVNWTPGNWLMVKADINGTGATVTVRAKVWPVGLTEPEAWQIQWDDTDASRITAAGNIRFKTGASTGYTANAEHRYDFFEWADTATGSTGGARAIGVCAGEDGSSQKVVLVASEALGVRRRVAAGSWATVATSGAPAVTAPASKSAPMDWPYGDTIAWLFDRKSGIYRSTDAGANWVRILAVVADNTANSTGFMAVKSDNTQVFYTSAGKLWRIDDADTVGAGAAVPIDAGVPNAGPLCFDPDGNLWVTRFITTGAPAALLFSSDLTTFVDMADDYYRGTCILPFGISVGPTGKVYVALNGNGLSVGNPVEIPPAPPPVTDSAPGAGDVVRPDVEAHTWRWWAVNFKTGVRLDELELFEVRVDDTLNEPGALTATVQLPSAGVDRHTRGNLDPGRTGIVAERDGVPVWAGELQVVRVDPDGRKADIACRGTAGYWDDVEVADDLKWTQVEQHTIFRNLIEYCENQVVAGTLASHLGIRFDTSLSGVVRTRTMLGNESRKIGDMLRSLSQVRNGFDFSISLQWEGTTLVRTLNCHYPQRGRSTEIVWQGGRNIEPFEYEVSSENQLTRVRVFGSGDATARPVAVATAPPDIFAGGYMLRDGSFSHSTLNDVPTLLGHAQSRLKAASTPYDDLKVVQIPGTAPEFGAWQLGDLCHLRQQTTYEDLDRPMRIVGWSCEIGPSGSEQWTINLSNVDRYVEDGEDDTESE